MNYNIITRTFVLSVLASITLAFAIFLNNHAHTKITVVFCDVGQGDATYIRLENKVDILIDAGPDKKVLSCLSKYMPFFDRTIELAFMSHPQKDHYGGYLDIFDRYQVRHFYGSFASNSNASINLLKKKILAQNILMEELHKDDVIQVQGARIDVLWPLMEPKDQASTKRSDPNTFSQMLVFTHKGRKILFTGDIYGSLVEQYISKVDLLKVPHHGSVNGLTAKMLLLADPSIAVISVGKMNRYGHPAKAILDLLAGSKIRIRRTDLEGDILFRY